MQTAPNDTKRLNAVLSTTRVAGVIGALLLLGVTLVAATRDRLAAVAAPGPAALADVLAALAGLSALALVAGLLGSTALAVLTRLPGVLGWAAGWADAQLTPRALRHVSGILLGATVGTMALPSTGLAEVRPRAVAVQPVAGALPAADPLTGSGRTTAEAPALAAPDPLFRAARPAVRPQLAPDLLTGSRVAAPAGVVVHRGDTLWDIVGRALGPDATDLEVAREWPRWYAANRDVIGDDPDLILPGQVLSRPTTATAAPVGHLTAPDPTAPHEGR